MIQSYFANIRYIAKNIILLYRNFFHWNLSKLIILAYENILALLLSLPLAGIIVYQYFSTYNQLGLSIGAGDFLLNNIGNIILTAILFIAIIAIFIATYTYGNFLMQNVYKSYLAGERLSYWKNLYFSSRHFRTYTGIVGWIFLYLLIPIAIAAVLIVPVGLFIQMNPGIIGKIAGGVSLLIFICLLVWFFYLSLRLVFSYYGLLYDDNMGKSRSYVQESFRITKGKVWKIIFLLTPFLLTIGIIGSIAQGTETSLIENRVYSVLRNEQIETGKDDHVLIENYFQGSDDKKAEFGAMEKTYSPRTDDIDREFLSEALYYLSPTSIDSSLYFYEGFFVIFSLLCLEWVSSMIYFSIYHIIRKES